MAKTNRMRRIYKLSSLVVTLLAVGYLLLLIFPKPLFAHSSRYESYRVYSREPLPAELDTVIAAAERRLRASPLYDGSIQRDVFLTGSHGMYALLSHKAYNSFANSIPFIENIIINKADLTADRVFLNRERNNSRSLSGVIAHEVTHIFIQRRYGVTTSLTIPVWKKEGYCEYIAGDSTITLDEGIRLWRENPSDDTGYRYIKFHLMVRHLLEKERISVDELFTRSLDENVIAARTFEALEK